MPWKKTTCSLCNNRCGLEVWVEANRIVKVRPDSESPISEGYACRKGINIAYHQQNTDRVLFPLKKDGGQFRRISWDQAISEIAHRLQDILREHGPRALASLYGGGEFRFETMPFLVSFVRLLGSRYYYSALNQEFAGRYWAHGLTLGSQGLQFSPDYGGTDMLLALGWNGWMSHHMPQARRALLKMSKDPSRLLVVVDPRMSETAKIADIHLALRPGTDALLLKSMIALILREGLYNRDYVDSHVDGFNQVLAWFADLDVESALEVCELEYDKVLKVSREFASRKSCIRDDLGILMNRHSALVSYLQVVLLAICGRIGSPGGNYLIGGRSYSDPGDPSTWRTLATNIPAINGMFSPNVLPEEITSDRPDRPRAVFTCAANPLRSYADTTAYEKAFGQLDLLVVAEIAMSETASLAHYVLPCRSAYESWDNTSVGDIHKSYGRVRRPVVEPEGEQKEIGEIYTLLADAMGIVPELPDSLYQTAKQGTTAEYFSALTDFTEQSPKNSEAMLFVVSKTLGKTIGSAHLANYFASFLRNSKFVQEDAVRAGFAAKPDQGLDIYRAILQHPEGLLIGIRNPSNNLRQIATKDGKIHIGIGEVKNWLSEINSADERRLLKVDNDYPLILMAGQHMDTNANTDMRDPAWNAGRRACTLAMNSDDAKELGLADGQLVKVVTNAGEEVVETEVTQSARRGQVVMPHGFGLTHNGVKTGANVNRLTESSNRDQFGTPMHKFVRCRVEAI